MSNRFAAVFNVVFLSLTLALLLASSQGFAQEDKPADAAAATEDIIHMTDGRVLHGKVLNETRSLVIFEYTDTTVNLTTKLTLLKDEIARSGRSTQDDRDQARCHRARDNPQGGRGGANLRHGPGCRCNRSALHLHRSNEGADGHGHQFRGVQTRR